MHRAGIRMGAIAALATHLLAALPACSSSALYVPPAASDRHPMLLVGVDGLEWNVIRPLLDAGQLPVLAGLIERGVAGSLASATPTLSPVIWTSIATGKEPDQHGITGFVYRAEGDTEGQRRTFTSGHRKTKAFWNILSDYNFRVHCVGWWLTYPAEEINGVMVSQTNTTAVLQEPRGQVILKGALLKGVEGQVHPLERQNEMLDILEEVDGSLTRLTEEIFGTLPHAPDRLAQMLWDTTQWAFRADATYLGAARRILEAGEPFDLLALYLGGPDVVGHRFWRYAYPGSFRHPPPRDQIENFGRILDDYCRYIDRSIGQLMLHLPEDATILVVSDHGMHSFNEDRLFQADDPRPWTLSGHHKDAPPGVLIAAGRGVRASGSHAGALQVPSASARRTNGSVLDVTPTLLALKGLPVGKDMDGRVLTEIISPEWLARYPVRIVRTHDREEWLRTRAARMLEAVDQAERIEQLRALGYIE